MKINLNAPIGYTGYGVAGLNVALGLERLGHEVALFQKGNPSVDSHDDAKILSNCVSRQDGFDKNAPCLKIWHQFDLAERIGCGPYTAFPFFELNQFTGRERTHINVPDQVFVTSKWAKEVVSQYRDPSSVKIVPLGVNGSIFHYREQPRNRVFKIANFGKWEKRKGHDVLPEIFNSAFSENDAVELHLFPHNPFLKPEEINEWTKQYYSTKLGHKVWIHDRLETHTHLALEMSKVDIGIFPARAEGWNLELLEMMAMGKPVIATNYSAHRQYCTPDNCTLIDIDKVETARDGKWFFGGGDWAHLGKPQLDGFIEALRDEYKKWQSADWPIRNLNGEETAKRLTWGNTCGIIASEILLY